MEEARRVLTVGKDEASDMVAHNQHATFYIPLDLFMGEGDARLASIMPAGAA